MRRRSRPKMRRGRGLGMVEKVRDNLTVGRMASVRVDIVSIGTLSRNRLWGEGSSVRTPHATTTLIRTGKRNIIVDPGLPAQVLGARLGERTGVKAGEIDTV